MSDSRARPSNSRSRLSCPPELPRKAPIPVPRNEVSLYASGKLLDWTHNNSIDHIANVDKKQQKKQIFLVPPALKVLYLSKANERRYLEVNCPLHQPLQPQTILPRPPPRRSPSALWKRPRRAPIRQRHREHQVVVRPIQYQPFKLSRETLNCRLVRTINLLDPPLTN